MQREFHHVVIARDEPGADNVLVWLDEMLQLLSVVDWEGWDSNGLDGDSWTIVNPSTRELAELNLTSIGTVPTASSRSLGPVCTVGINSAEDLTLEYLAPNNLFPISLNVAYVSPELTVGDLNFDSEINVLDGQLYANGLGKMFSGLASLEAFQMGDMDSNIEADYTRKPTVP